MQRGEGDAPDQADQQEEQEMRVSDQFPHSTPVCGVFAFFLPVDQLQADKERGEEKRSPDEEGDCQPALFHQGPRQDSHKAEPDGAPQADAAVAVFALPQHEHGGAVGQGEYGGEKSAGQNGQEEQHGEVLDGGVGRDGHDHHQQGQGGDGSVFVCAVGQPGDERQGDQGDQGGDAGKEADLDAAEG